VIPVRAGHGAAVGSFFPGEPPPGFHPAPLDLARMVQISWYRFGPQRTVDSVHRGCVNAHVSAPMPAWCTAPISSRHVAAQPTAAVKPQSAALVFQKSPSISSESTRSPT
jgi:hypothetical protein